MADAKDALMGRGTVARGRTVVIPDTTKKKIVNHTPEGKPIYQAILNEFGPGHEVNLPLDEIKQLRVQGYLIDPGATAPEREIGTH